MRKKERPHDFCSECGADLGEIPPPPPKCRRCHRPVKGHGWPWGEKRCKFKPAPRDPYWMDKFFTSTLKAYRVAFDKALMEEHPALLGKTK